MVSGDSFRGYYGLDTSNLPRPERSRRGIQSERYIQMYGGRVCIRPYRFNLFLLTLAGLLSTTQEGKGRECRPPASQPASPVHEAALAPSDEFLAAA